MADFVQVAYISKAKGLNGEVVVTSAGDRPLFLPAGLEVWLVPPEIGVVRQSRVLAVNEQAKGFIAQLQGVDNRDTAQRLAGHYLLARVADVPEAQGKANDASLIGCTVLDVSEGVTLVGWLREIRPGAAQDLWVVEDGPYGQVLIPAVPEFICGVSEVVISVRLPKGLLELYGINWIDHPIDVSALPAAGEAGEDAH